MELNQINFSKEITLTNNQTNVKASQNDKASQKEDKFNNALHDAIKCKENNSKDEPSSISSSDDIEDSKINLDKIKDILKDTEHKELSEEDTKLLISLLQNLNVPDNTVDLKLSDSALKNGIAVNPKIKGIIIDDGRFYKLAEMPIMTNDRNDTKAASMEELKNNIIKYLNSNEASNKGISLETIKNLLMDKLSNADNSSLKKLNAVHNAQEIISSDAVENEVMIKSLNGTENSVDLNDLKNLRQGLLREEIKNNNQHTNSAFDNKLAAAADEVPKKEGIVYTAEQSKSNDSLKKFDIKSADTIINKESKLSSKEDKILKSFVNDTDSSTAKISSLPLKLSLNEKSILVNKVDTPVVNKATFVNDIIKSIKYMDNEGIKNLTVKINPKELGEVVIRISMEQGNMKATINATSKEGYNILSQNFSELNQKIADANLKIQSFDLGQYQNGANLFSEGGNKENPNNSHKSKRDSILGIDDEEEINKSEEMNNNLNIFV